MTARALAQCPCNKKLNAATSVSYTHLDVYKRQEYRTNWGEEVRISGLFPESIPLRTTDGIYWTAEVELEIPHEGMIISYNYHNNTVALK